MQPRVNASLGTVKMHFSDSFPTQLSLGSSLVFTKTTPVLRHVYAVEWNWFRIRRHFHKADRLFRFSVPLLHTPQDSPIGHEDFHELLEHRNDGTSEENPRQALRRLEKRKEDVLRTLEEESDQRD